MKGDQEIWPNKRPTWLPFMAKVLVTFVRHGETNENRNKIIQGQMDSALNELGLRQADAVAEALKNVPFTHAFSSDLSRARTVCIV